MNAVAGQVMFRVMALLAGITGIAEGQAPRGVATISLREADLALAADSSAGLILIFQPGVATAEGRAIEGPVWLRFHPDSALEWLNNAASAIGGVPAAGAADGVQWSRPLNTLDGRGAFALGRERKKGQLQRRHWMAIRDSTAGWRLELTGGQADSLLCLVLVLGGQAGLDPRPGEDLEIGGVDIPARVVHQSLPRARGLLGQVVVQSVVGVDGRVEPGSSAVYLVTDPSLIEAALAIVRDTRFLPARRGGQPVRQLVRQVIAWRIR